MQLYWNYSGGFFRSRVYWDIMTSRNLRSHQSLSVCATNRTAIKQWYLNIKVYVGVGIPTIIDVSHLWFTAVSVLLRCSSGLAQSLSLTTPIRLTAGVASLLLGFTCFFFLKGARATRHPSVICTCGFTRNWMILWIPIL